jgi:hypothetical protein
VREMCMNFQEQGVGEGASRKGFAVWIASEALEG